MRTIVTDTYDFPTLIRDRNVYVDKTALLHRLISRVDGSLFFMSRPRRFGKSLKQCHERQYALPYADDARRIVYVGVNYDTLKRNVDTVNDTVNDTLNDTLNSRILTLVKQRPGVHRPDMISALGVSESSIARCLRTMRTKIEFRGAAKTGGYFALIGKQMKA